MDHCTARDRRLAQALRLNDMPFGTFKFPAGNLTVPLCPCWGGYAGYLQADALAQYEGLFAAGRVVHVACNAHARRRFVGAQGSAPAEAGEALTYYRSLYQVERELGQQFAADD